MKLIYLLLSFIASGAAVGQTIDIPDANLKSKLLQANPDLPIAYIFDDGASTISKAQVDTNNDGEIQISEAAVIVKLDLSNSNISSIEGIDQFQILFTLDLTYNNITNLDFSNYSASVLALWLNVSHNPLQVLTFGSYTGLSNLTITNTLMTSLDLRG